MLGLYGSRRRPLIDLPPLNIDLYSAEGGATPPNNLEKAAP
jgi:hypothetical protein